MIRAVKGTRDILPAETPGWQRVEDAARRLLARYGFREIRTPAFEETQLFARSIGGETDIVSKEMYTFDDRDGSSLTLRPEATAGVARAVIEHNLAETDPILKLFMIGPMFRREQPQKGRQRQFHQINVEAFGMTRPSVDVEMIELSLALLDCCGMKEGDLFLNSVGDANCRPRYVAALREALRTEEDRLCADCRRRSETNPLRVLDCKVAADQAIIERLPRITDYLCPQCRDHFNEVRRQLDLLDVPYRLNHRLVRGLDYYTRTTFEIVARSEALGAQNSVLGGGRYDGLIKDLGGPDLAGIGFAIGMERLVLASSRVEIDEKRCDVFLVPLGAPAFDRALVAQRDLRRSGRSALIDHEARGLKAQMRKADKIGARYVALLGDNELARGVWSVRDMTDSRQEEVPEEDFVGFIERRFNG
ncbi:MAG: histidine--tRNA ligase [Vicinamibacteria bacterium]|nr:histidine--tRNA ligase [Vicinamibacteria bacterium]